MNVGKKKDLFRSADINFEALHYVIEQAGLLANYLSPCLMLVILE